MLTYERNKKYWNEVFRNETGNIITTKSIGHEEVDKDLDWLCQDSDSILDFGCGNGVWLFRCFLRGTSEHIGIDISEEGIRVAEEIHKIMKRESLPLPSAEWKYWETSPILRWTVLFSPIY